MMSTTTPRKSGYCFLILHVLFTGQHFVIGALTLTGSPAAENTSLKLTCTYTGTGTLKLFTMTLNQSLEGSLYPNCTTFAKHPDILLYEYNCLNRTQLKWTIKTVTRANEGQIWTCEVVIGTSYEKAKYTVSVQVPVQSVTLTSPQDSVVTVKENEELVFVCTTSGGLPGATVRWYKMQGTTPAASDVAITNLVTVSTTNTSDDLVSVTSTLRFSPTRGDNGIGIYCTANNSANIVHSVRKPSLNVQYSPGSPTISGFSNGSTYKVIENFPETLICSIEGGNPLATLSWDCFNVGEASVTVGTKVTMNVTLTATRDKDRTCTCQSSHIVAGEQDVFVRVQVLYPPDKPIFKINSRTLSGPASFIEGQTRSIVCVGKGNPSPNIYNWINGSKTISDEAALTLNNIKKTDDGEYSCEVKNTMIPTSGEQKIGTNTSVVKVMVLFAPSSPIFFYESLNRPQITRNSIDVVRGETFAIACKSDGEPTPAYRWSGQTSDYHILSVTSINEHDLLSRTCTATNTMRETYGTTRDGSSQRNLTFNVLYPPSINSCTMTYTPGSSVNVAGSVAVLEGSSFSLTCATSSNPAVDSYSWSGPIMSSSAVLDISSINRGQNGTFTLTAMNNMVKTFGGSVPGKDTKNITFDILYAPTVRPLASQDIIAGSQLNLSCPVIKGNPAVTSFEWTRNDSMAWNQQILYIKNVTKHDDMVYTCTVQNTMKPTGASQQNGKGNGSFHLNVLYRATVTSFFIQDYKDNQQSIFTVNENDTLPMKCVVESNPGSQIDLLFNNEILKSKGDTTDIVFSEKMAFCSEAGVYTCSAKNQYNDGIPSIKTFTLNVRCSPRPLGPVNTTIFSARRVEAYFNFTGLAYPVPPPSNFIWKKKEENTVWKTLSNSSTTRIFISGLFTYLKLTNVSQSDYGEYRLIITNTVGNYTQTFHLEPEGVPEVPSELRIVEKFVTETSALLQWKPAFNGGPEQTFTIMYKKSSEQKWVNITVTDTGEATMNYTLSPLDSGSQYTVIISSRNRVGESAGSRNATFITKALRGSSSVALIGGAVGGGIGCALVITFIVLLVLRFRRNKGNSKKQDKKDDRKPVYKDEDDYGMQDNPMYVSAGPRDEAQSASKNTSDGSAAVYSTVDKAKTAVSGAGNDVYVYDKTKKKKQGKPDKSKPGILLDKKGKKHNQGGDIYENASTTELKVKKKKNDDNIYENPEPRKKFEKKNVNKDGLIYADLAFNDQPKGQKKLIIHGIEDITEYVTVDFTKKADPLPDSDDENCTPKK